MAPTVPIHIHAAEQQREVDACLAWSGRRPVEWLLDNAGVDSRWCLVHATHMNAAETGSLKDCLDLEAWHHTRTGFTEDHREAAKAFVEKREPVFRGR